MPTTEKEYQNPQYLVETDWLEAHLEDADLRLFDCTVNIAPNTSAETTQGNRAPVVFNSGRSHYDQGHIPGAGFIDVADELSDATSLIPLMLPPEQKFVEMISQYGINNDSRVILYSTSEPNWAARVWWMLHAYGFDNAAILNGGWAKWHAEERPVSTQACTYTPGQFTVQADAGAFVGKHTVLEAVSNDDVRIISALPAEMFSGTSKMVFGRKGRISNSCNIPFASLHDSETGRYLSADALHKQFSAVNIDEAKQIITYCGGGIAAANDAFALALLGYDNVAVYDGSMLEWGFDPSLPMEMD